MHHIHDDVDEISLKPAMCIFNFARIFMMVVVIYLANKKYIDSTNTPG